MSDPVTDRQEFLQRYGGIYEHSPWVAEKSFAELQDVDDVATMLEVFARHVNDADLAARIALIQAHPDLAGRAAVCGELTAASVSEQASAGIDQCTAEEFERFQTFNDDYRQKFNFPFVMAVRGSNRHAILAAFERRLKNDTDEEIETAINEIHKIARLRLQAMIDSEDQA